MATLGLVSKISGLVAATVAAVGSSALLGLTIGLVCQGFIFGWDLAERLAQIVRTW